MTSPSPTSNNHPITPPPDLVQQWKDAWAREKFCYTMEDHVAVEAARWGANEELEACCEWLEKNTGDHMAIEFLRDARRPKPPSLKDQAFEALHQIDGWAVSNIKHLSIHDELVAGVDTIRRALESLPD